MAEQDQKKSKKTPEGLKEEVEVKQDANVPQVGEAMAGVGAALKEHKVKGRMLKLRGATGDDPELEWDMDDPDSVAVAEDKFDSLKAQGWSILVTDGQGNSEVAHNFDKAVQEYFIIPQIAGGANG